MRWRTAEKQKMKLKSTWYIVKTRVDLLELNGIKYGEEKPEQSKRTRGKQANYGAWGASSR